MKKLFFGLCLLGFVSLPTILALADTPEGTFKRNCAGCHGADGSKSTGGTAPIKGLSADELNALLNGYKDGSKGGARKNVMVNVLKRLTDENRDIIVEYISTSLK